MSADPRITKNELRLELDGTFEVDIKGRSDTAGEADNALALGGKVASAATSPNTIPVRDTSGNIAGTVPTTRTINGQALSSNVNITAANIGAATASHSHTLDSLGAASDTHSHTKTEIGLGNVANTAQMPLTGGTFMGAAIAQTNTNYTTRQLRNVVMSTAAPSGGFSGDIWLKYE